MINHQKLNDVPELVAESTTRAQFADGSRIIALPGSTHHHARLCRRQLIILDEAARVPDELLAALRPMLATVDGSADRALARLSANEVGSLKAGLATRLASCPRAGKRVPEADAGVPRRGAEGARRARLLGRVRARLQRARRGDVCNGADRSRLH